MKTKIRPHSSIVSLLLPPYIPPIRLQPLDQRVPLDGAEQRRPSQKDRSDGSELLISLESLLGQRMHPPYHGYATKSKAADGRRAAKIAADGGARKGQ